MREYIEREALEKWMLTEMASLDSEEDRQYVVERLRESIPAADVRPVVRGKWTNKRTITHDGEWYCNLCEFEPYYAHDIHTLNFCPNCGADMRGES